MPKIAVILGSVRDGRKGEAVAEWTLAEATSRSGDFSYELVDLKEFDLPLLDAAVPPKAANRNYHDERVKAWSAAIDSYDGFVFVTAEYNRSFPGAFKNAFDTLAPEWENKPIAFVAYGGVKGVNSVKSWRFSVQAFSMNDVEPQVGISLRENFPDGQFQANDALKAELDETLSALEATFAAS